MWRLSANRAWKSCFSFQNNLKGADWSRHIFVHSATAMALNKIPAMSPSSPGHCGQYDTMYATIGCVLRKAFADDTILGVHREQACMKNIFARRAAASRWCRVPLLTLGWESRGFSSRCVGFFLCSLIPTMESVRA